MNNHSSSHPTHAKAESERRQVRHWIILPHFQLGLMIVNFAILLVAGLAVWFGFERGIGDLKPAAGLAEYQAEFFRNYVQYQLVQMRWTLALSLGFGIVISCALTLFWSHRLAGPILRLRGYFKSIQENRTRPGDLSFREGDYFSDLPETINGALRRLESDSESHGKPRLKKVSNQN